MNSNKLITPVLFIIFNRPDCAQAVFNEIKKAKPSKLYVSADGPRTAVTNDEINCTLTREIIKQIDWDCELHTRFLKDNLGCGPGPATAISWAFQNEDKLIILEDDCVPVKPFFFFCQEMLDRYEDDKRIWLISGNNPTEEKMVFDYSYFFSLYGHSWGWATWKRCWKHFDFEMTQWPDFYKQNRFNDLFPTKEESDFFKNIYSYIFNDKNKLKHIWDFQFGFTIRTNSGLCIVPKKNLVKNIGFIGSHADNKTLYHDRKVDPDFTVKNHPEYVLASRSYDYYHYKKHWVKMMQISFFNKIIRKIKKIIKH